MPDDTIHHFTPAELAVSPVLAEALLALNNDHAVELSWLEPDGLAHLAGEAFAAWRVGAVDAFLIAVDQDARYDSPNFLWHKALFPRFVYVDRVVVAARARGRGLARTLYLKLFEAARAVGHDKVVCEVNADPPNPASDAFHAALGFEMIGMAEVYNGAKTVTYLAKTLSP